MGYFNEQLAKGKKDEEVVISHLRSQGYTIERPTEYQDRREDTDCFIVLSDGNRLAVSIKSQQAGVKYGHIYFELYQQVKPEYRVKFQCTPRNTWIKSNHFTGKHDVYAIYQGDKIYLMYRDTVDEYVAKYGWLHIKGLSKYRKDALSAQAGYYFQDSKCGFLPNNVLEYFHVLEVNNA